MKSLLIAYILLMLLPFFLHGETLDYDSIVKKACEMSPDIRVAHQDTRVSRASLKGVYALRYPTIKAQGGRWYTRSLGEDGSLMLGDAVIPKSKGGTQRDVITLSGTYTLFDFGALSHRISMAKGDIKAREVLKRQIERDVRLKVLDAYSAILSTSREIDTRKELLRLSQEMVTIKEALHKEGVITYDDVTEEKVRVIRITKEIDALMGTMRASLYDLGFHTGDTYREDIEVNDLPLPRLFPFDKDRAPEALFYAHEIQKKKDEMGAIKKGVLPRVEITSGYSLHEGRPRDFYGGIMVTMTLFDGLRSMAETERIREEIGKLEAERDRRCAELVREYEKSKDAQKTHGYALLHQKEALEKTHERLHAMRDVHKEGLATRIDIIHRKIEALHERLTLVKETIARVTMGQRMDILGGVL